MFEVARTRQTVQYVPSTEIEVIHDPTVVVLIRLAIPCYAFLCIAVPRHDSLRAVLKRSNAYDLHFACSRLPLSMRLHECAFITPQAEQVHHRCSMNAPQFPHFQPKLSCCLTCDVSEAMGE